jgi:uncharacterized SAM-dependent methyltransferase
VAQQAAIDQIGLTVSLKAGEAIHTENSYKYAQTEIEALAVAAGLRYQRHWLDPEGKFTVALFLYQ